MMTTRFYHINDKLKTITIWKPFFFFGGGYDNCPRAIGQYASINENNNEIKFSLIWIN